MKEKGIREQYPEGVRYRETTRDERIKVIAFREAGWGWTKIGNHLNIDRRTCQKVNRYYADMNSYGMKELISEKIYQRIRETGTPSN